MDLYVTYWKAVGEILDAECMRNEANWLKVYEAWKEVANVLIRGYSSAGFQAWTVPCLYVIGQYLRIFAIRADASMKSSPQDGVFGAGSFQDDIVGEYSKNERLEDAARMINRIFTLCISDRYAGMKNPCFWFRRCSLLDAIGLSCFHRAPIEDSRKWGLYYTTNLLFKTYFKVCHIGLS